MNICHDETTKPKISFSKDRKNKLKFDELAFFCRRIPELADSTYALYKQQMVAYEDEINAVRSGDFDPTQPEKTEVLGGDNYSEIELNRKVEQVKEKFKRIIALCDLQPELIDSLDIFLDLELLPRIDNSLID